MDLKSTQNQDDHLSSSSSPAETAHSTTTKHHQVTPKSRFKRRKLLHRAGVLLTIIALAQVIPARAGQEDVAQEAQDATNNDQQSQPQPQPQPQPQVQTTKQWRQQQHPEETGDGFIMKTPQEARELSSTSASELPAGNVDVKATTTISSILPDENYASYDDGRIPINVTRQQFLTHDQLLSASTKDEPSQTTVTSSRSGMPRLAFASSFLSDLLFRPRQQPAGLGASRTQQQEDLIQHQQQNTLPTTTTSPQYQQQASQPTISAQNSRPKTQQQQQQYNSCPGVCLNLLVASIRCQNAVQAPCPSILQKCCEMDGVSFNGTPVETSAPLPNGDLDPVPAAPSADVPASPPQDGPDEQEGHRAAALAQATPATSVPNDQQQPQQTATAAHSINRQQQPEQVPSSLSPDPRLPPGGGAQVPRAAAATPPASANELAHDQLLDDNQSRSVYFLSSGADSAATGAGSGASGPDGPEQPNRATETATGADQQDGKPLEQQREKLLPTKPAESKQQQQASDADLAQSASEHKLSASQSFDSPMTATSSSPSSTTARPSDRVVVIQTANGTAYLHSGSGIVNPSLQSFMRSRPLYANWTDYQMLMLHSRLPQNQQQVVYHSNIDPVRRQSNGQVSNATTTTSEQQTLTNDLNSNSKVTHSQQDPELKVLKDQHSGGSKQQQQQSFGGQADRTSISATTTTTMPMPTTTTTELTSYAATATAEESTYDEVQQQQNGGEATPSPVGGIANLLGSLFDSFMSSSSSSIASTQDGPEEARGPHEGQQLMTSEQQNDRRLGLDLSFRQPNELVPASHQLTFSNNQSQLLFGGSAADQSAQMDGTESLMTSDNEPQVTQLSSDSQPQMSGCVGYCSLDSFLHLCDSHYATSACGRSQKCCVTANGEQQPTNQDSPGRPGASNAAPNQQQACRGTCLPIYHSSLCMKPNEIQMDSPSCLPSQLCCAQPSMMVDQLGSGNHLDQEGTSSSDEAVASLAATTLHQASQPSGLDGVTDGSFNKDHSLSVALVPPPPPSIVEPQQQQQAQHSIGGRNVHMNPYQQQLAASGYTQLVQPTARPLAHQATNNNQQQQQQQSGGIMNQIFQMFKSNTASLTKQRQQRPQVQQQQPAQVLAVPQQVVYEFAQISPANAAQVYNKRQQNFNQHQQQMGSASGLRPTIQTPPANQQQLVFPTNPGGPQILIGPNGQPFAVAASQQYVTPTHAKPSEPNSAAFFTDPAQFAAMLQKQQQFVQPPPAHRQAQQLAVNQFQMHPHPALGVQMTPSEQQQVAQMNQMSFHQMNQQQNVRANQQRPVATFQTHQLPARWTHPEHSNSNNNNAQQLASVTAPSRQQQQLINANHVGAKQQQQQGGNVVGASSMSFGPLDAASSTVASQSGGQFMQLQQQHRPANMNTRQQSGGWTGTSSMISAQEHQQANLEQQQRRAKLPPPQANNNRPHDPEADANFVSAVMSQHQVANVARRPTVGQKQPMRVVGVQQQQQVSPARSPALVQQPSSSGLPKIIPTTTSTQAPPLRKADQQTSSSNLTPVHSATPDLDLASDSADSGPSGSSYSSLDLQPSTSTSANDDAEQPASEDAADPQSSSDPLAGSGSSSAVVSSLSASQHNSITSEQASGSSSMMTTSDPDQQLRTGSMHSSKVATTACGLPGPSRLDLRLNSVAVTTAAGRTRAGRVMGGFDSEPGYWCWQAALMNGKNEYLCGGALIGTKWVLTAAHCVTQHLRSESQLYVRLGQTNLNTTNLVERQMAKNVLVKTSYVHHNHNGITLDNDIALLRLDEPVDLSEPNVCTVCLPEGTATNSNNQHKHLEPGRRCTVTGFGYAHESGPAALRVRQTDLPLVADQECASKVGGILQKPFVLPASSFCAGGELGQDACHGDGGSPLACQQDGYYVLEGLVSWGYRCGNKDLPGLYAKVSNFVGWINQIVSVNS